MSHNLNLLTIVLSRQRTSLKEECCEIKHVLQKSLLHLAKKQTNKKTFQFLQQKKSFCKMKTTTNCSLFILWTAKQSLSSDNGISGQRVSQRANAFVNLWLCIRGAQCLLACEPALLVWAGDSGGETSPPMSFVPRANTRASQATYLFVRMVASQIYVTNA